MEPKTNNTLVGIMVLILVFALIAGCLWLSIGFNSKKYTPYLVYMNEAVSGLSQDAPVKFNGVQVGVVHDIKLNAKNPRQVELLLYIEQNTPITKSTSATLISQGITGNTYVELAAKNSNLEPLAKTHAAPYPVIPSEPSLFYQLDHVLKDVSQNINAVSVNVRRIFDKENAAFIKNILSNIKSLSQTLDNNNQHIAHSLQQLDTIFSTFNRSSKKMPLLIDKLAESSKEVKPMMRAVRQAATDISFAMQNGQKTIEQFKQSTLPSLSHLLLQWNNISRNINMLSDELRRKPNALIFGKPKTQLGPGEGNQQKYSSKSR